MSELLFLTRYGHLSQTVVYAGAAPGTHIVYLSELFPNHSFVLVDPCPFHMAKVAHQRIQIINGYFDDQLAAQYTGQKVLFISDIRTADYRQMEETENEQYIMKDNQSQIKWVQIMQPAKSMLKFRCPYPDKVSSSKTSMFKGEIWLQVWPPASSTETRLIVDDSLDMVEYDNLQYEQQLFYHNTETRYQTFPQPVKGEGLDQSFDVSAEVVILAEYLETHPTHVKKNPLATIAAMSQTLSRHLSSGRTLKTAMKEPGQRRQFPQTNHRSFYEENQGRVSPEEKSMPNI